MLCLSYALRAEYLTPAIPLRSVRYTAALSSRVDPSAIYATLRRVVLPASHCVFKLGGQVAFAQQLRTHFFGTVVQSDHEGRAKPTVPLTAGPHCVDFVLPSCIVTL